MAGSHTLKVGGLSMVEYPIARMYADARVQNIHGGTNEVMKDLIARKAFA